MIPPCLSLASLAMGFAQERKLNICVEQVMDDEVFISCDGERVTLKVGATAEIRLSDQRQAIDLWAATSFRPLTRNCAKDNKTGG